MNNVGIIGSGFVGNAVETGFQEIANVRVYDKFKDSESLDDVVNESDIIFICVPTPMGDDGECDISIVESVAAEINEVAENRKIIIIKSTVTPGTTQMLAECFRDHTWMFNPEFLRESTFIEDFFNQDRIMVGVTDGCLSGDINRVLDFYKEFTRFQKERNYKVGTIIEVKSTEAEMLKYMTNCFLATKIIFCNEIYEICKSLNISYENVRKLFHTDVRIGSSHTQVPGADGQFGYGGACFYKDLNGLRHFAQELNIDTLLLDSVNSKNLLIREEYDWEEISGVTGKYKK